MDIFGTLTRLFIAVALLGDVCHCWEAYVQGPVKAVRGSCVLVPCNTVTYTNVKWYAYRRMSYPVVYSNDRSEIMDEFKGRTSVPNALNGNCTLKIDNVRQQDSEVDLYVWIWKYGGEDKGFYDRTIKINILDPVRPHMSVANTQVEGKPFTATCRFRHSCPSAPPQMSWQGLSSTSNVLTHRKDVEGLWETEATATFRVTRQNQGARLSCRTVLSGQTLESGSVSLDISYAPTDVKIDYIGRTSVVEGEKISLQCTSKGKPQPTAYEWLVTQNSNTIRLKGSTVLLQDVRRRTSVSCIATNSVGHGESKQLSLDVHYSPSIVQGLFCSMQNRKLQCVCQAEAKPSAVISWTVDGSSEVFPPFNTTTQHNGSMTVSELTGPQGHNVTCTATNVVGSEFTQILVQSEGDTSAVFAVVGASVGVCVILGLAVTVLMIWKKRRHAVPRGGLSTAQHVTANKTCHDYSLESDEDLYVNAVHGQQVYEDQDAESCIYQNYDKSS